MSISIAFSQFNRRRELVSLSPEKPLDEMTADEITFLIKSADQISAFFTQESERDHALATCSRLSSAAEFRGTPKVSPVSSSLSNSVGVATCSREQSRVWDGDAVLAKLGIQL